MLWRTAAKHHQLKIKHRRPWRQSNHGTVGRRCCHRWRHHRGPRVHRLNATVDVEMTCMTFRRRSSASKRTRACFEANCGRYDAPSSTPMQTPEFDRNWRYVRVVALYVSWADIPGQTRDPTVVDDRWQSRLEPWSQAATKVHYHTATQVHRLNDWSSIQDDRYDGFVRPRHRNWPLKKAMIGQSRYRALNNQLRRETDKVKEKWWDEQYTEFEKMNKMGRTNIHSTGEWQI